MKKHHESFQAFLKATLINIRSIDAWINIAILYELNNQPEAARRAYQIVLQINQDNKTAQESIDRISDGLKSTKVEFVHPDIRISKFPFTKIPIKKPSKVPDVFVENRRKESKKKKVEKVLEAKNVPKSEALESLPETTVEQTNETQTNHHIDKPYPLHFQKHNPIVYEVFCRLIFNNKSQSKPDDVFNEDEAAKILLNLEQTVKRKKPSNSNPRKRIKL